MVTTRVGYAFLSPGGDAPVCRQHSVSDAVSAYLVDHVSDLLRRVGAGSTEPARFRSLLAQGRFEQLIRGTDAQFVAVAQVLCERVHTAMDQRSKAGFLVALTVGGDSETLGVVLKLDVNEKHAAAVRQVGRDLELEAVQGLLDLPGALQKGAVFPDPRPASDVVVGDRMDETALYFLRAIEVQQQARPDSAVRGLLSAVQRAAPGRLEATVADLDEYSQPVSPEDFFAQHPDLLSPAEQAAILAQLRTQTRPIEVIDPVRHPIAAVVRAGSIVIRGPRAEIDRSVTWVQGGGAWTIRISVTEPPSKSYT